MLVAGVKDLISHRKPILTAPRDRGPRCDELETSGGPLPQTSAGNGRSRTWA
jgi:hypothetical protein